MARVLCLPAFVAVTLNRLVQLVIGFDDAPVATVVVGRGAGCAPKREEASQRRAGQCYSAEELCPVIEIGDHSPNPPEVALAGVGCLHSIKHSYTSNLSLQRQVVKNEQVKRGVADDQ